MKKNMLITAGCGSALVVLSVLACKKPAAHTISERSNLSSAARVQLFNAIVSSNRNYLYVDGAAVNGATIAYGTTFPNSAGSFVAEWGVRNFLIKDTLATTKQVPMNFSPELTPRASYTIFAYDTITAPKYKIVTNNIVIPSDTTSRLRFANFIYGNPGYSGVDVYSVKRGTNIFTGVAKTGVTNFIPFASALGDTIILRQAGTQLTIAQINGLSLTGKRSYTIALAGGVSKGVYTFYNE